MSMPGFSADASLYRMRGRYFTSGGPYQCAARIEAAQLPTCSFNGSCGDPNVGQTCNCPAGQWCGNRRLPPSCRTECFLWWCWRRCEPSQLQTWDWFCQS